MRMLASLHGLLGLAAFAHHDPRHLKQELMHDLAEDLLESCQALIDLDDLDEF